MTQEDIDMLQDVLDRWESMCRLAANLVEAVAAVDVSVDTEEVLHHATSDYTTELQRELREFIGGQK